MNAETSGAARRAFAILPAAGRSVRMGTPKLLLPWGDDGKTVIEHVLDTWRRSRVDAVVLVVHPEDQMLAELGRRAGAEVVVASEPPPDMKASIRLGLAYVADRYRPQVGDLWLTAPADLPLLQTTTIDGLLAAAEGRPGVCLRPRHAGRFGHPVVWPWSLQLNVAGLGPNEGLNRLFQQVEWLAVDSPADCTAGDLDTPDDYRKLHPPHDRYKA